MALPNKEECGFVSGILINYLTKIGTKTDKEVK